MSTALITILSAAALTLTGCSSAAEPDDAARPAADADTATGIESDPLLVCGPLPNQLRAQFCVPGVGSLATMNASSGTTKGAGTQMRSLGAYKAGDTWVALSLTTTTNPSTGLTPATIGARLEILDIKADTLMSSVDLGNARVTGLIAVDGADTVIAALDSADTLRKSVAGSPEPDTEVTMVGVRPSDGTIMWKQNDVVTSTVGTKIGPPAKAEAPVLARSSSIPAYRIPKPSGMCAGRSAHPTEAITLDAATGEVTRSVALATLPGPRDKSNDCTNDVVEAGVTSPIMEITRARLGGFSDGGPNYNLRTNLLASNGAPLPRFGAADITKVLTDPVGDLAVITVTDHGPGLTSTTTTHVIDQASGEVRNTVDTAAISSVRGDIESIYDGRIYIQGPDDLFTLDAATGKEAGPAASIPVRDINGWTLHIDGSFTKTS